MTNSPTLQKLMDAQEATSRLITAGEQEVKAAEEMYAESTLPINQSSLPDDQKVLGVSVIGQIYDPLGFLSPVTILFKTLMQELCKFKLSWDQSMEGELLNKWKWLVNNLKDNQPIAIPRCYFQGAGVTLPATSCTGFAMHPPLPTQLLSILWRKLTATDTPGLSLQRHEWHLSRPCQSPDWSYCQQCSLPD